VQLIIRRNVFFSSSARARPKGSSTRCSCSRASSISLATVRAPVRVMRTSVTRRSLSWGSRSTWFLASMRSSSRVTVGCLVTEICASWPMLIAAPPDSVASTRHSDTDRPCWRATTWNSEEIRLLACASSAGR